MNNYMDIDDISSNRKFLSKTFTEKNRKRTYIILKKIITNDKYKKK